MITLDKADELAKKIVENFESMESVEKKMNFLMHKVAQNLILTIELLEIATKLYESQGELLTDKFLIESEDLEEGEMIPINEEIKVGYVT